MGLYIFFPLLRRFKEAWASIDPRATGYINVDDVSKFLRVSQQNDISLCHY